MWKIKEPNIDDLHRMNITLQTICMFMWMVKSDITDSKPNFTTKDYTLHQFQCYVWRKIDELKLVPRPNKKK